MRARQLFTTRKNIIEARADMARNNLNSGLLHNGSDAVPLLVQINERRVDVGERGRSPTARPTAGSPARPCRLPRPCRARAAHFCSSTPSNEFA